MCCMPVEPALCMCKAVACMYVILSIKSLQFEGDKCSNVHWVLRQGVPYTGRCGYSDDIRKHMWCNGSTLARNARYVGSLMWAGTIFPNLITLNNNTPLVVNSSMTSASNLGTNMQFHFRYVFVAAVKKSGSWTRQAVLCWQCCSLWDMQSVSNCGYEN